MGKGVVFAVNDPPHTNRSRKVLCPTGCWLTSGTIALLELTSTLVSPFLFLLVLSGSEMFANVGGVQVQRCLEVNGMRGED